MTFEPFNPGFSTADAQRPSLEFRAGELKLRFVDWQEQPVTAVFGDVVAFQWGDDLSTERWDDKTYIVGDSPWLSQYQLQGITTDAHRHFKLYFNSLGVLEVLASSVSISS